MSWDLSEEKQFRSLTLSGERFPVMEIGLCRGLLPGVVLAQKVATEVGRGMDGVWGTVVKTTW